MTRTEPRQAQAARQDVALAELLASRLCHDMASMCGALVGAIEVAIEDAGIAAEALPLAHEMATALAARLRLLRAAWGPPGDALDHEQLAALGRGLPGGPRVALDLSGLSEAACLDPGLARVVLNALLLAAEALPGGGRVGLSGDAAGLSVAIAGRRPAWPAALPGLLAQPAQAAAHAAAAGARDLLPPLLVLVARAEGVRLGLAHAATGGPAALLIEPGAPPA